VRPTIFEFYSEIIKQSVWDIPKLVSSNWLAVLMSVASFLIGYFFTALQQEHFKTATTTEGRIAAILTNFWPNVRSGFYVTCSMWIILFVISLGKTLYKNHIAIVQANEKLERQLEEKNRQRFEITHGSTITGEMTIVTETGAREEHTSVFMPVTVYNHGSPSIIRGTRLIATFQDDTQVEGERIIPSQKELIFRDLNLRFSRDQSLALKGSSSPIPTGGLCDGFVTFALPPGLREKIQTATLKLVIYDVDQTPYEEIIDMKDKGGPKHMITPPSMIQKQN